MDILVVAPTFDKTSGYGQASNQISKIMVEIAEEEYLSVGILSTQIPQCPKTKKHLVNGNGNLSCNILFTVSGFDKSKVPHKKSVILPLVKDSLSISSLIETVSDYDLIINPTIDGLESLQRHVKADFRHVHIPIDKRYYELLNNENILFSDTDRFRFITIGSNNRNITNLMKAFGKDKRLSKAQLYVKSLSSDIRKTPGEMISLCSRYDNLYLDLLSVSSKELYDIYLSSHCGLFISEDLEYRFPQIELAMMGRPIILAEVHVNSSFKYFFPELLSLQSYPSNNGFMTEYDINKFLNYAYLTYSQWRYNKEEYTKRLIENNNSIILRSRISYDSAKESYRKLLLRMMNKKY